MVENRIAHVKRLTEDLFTAWGNLKDARNKRNYELAVIVQAEINDIIKELAR